MRSIFYSFSALDIISAHPSGNDCVWWHHDDIPHLYRINSCYFPASIITDCYPVDYNDNVCNNPNFTMPNWIFCILIGKSPKLSERWFIKMKCRKIQSWEKNPVTPNKSTFYILIQRIERNNHMMTQQLSHSFLFCVVLFGSMPPFSSIARYLFISRTHW